MKLRAVLFRSFAGVLMITQVSLGQQMTGEFINVNGDFDIGTFTELTNPNVASGTELYSWKFNTAATNPVVALTSANSRSGKKSLSWGASSSSGGLFTPTFPNAAVSGNTSYVIQFYYWKNNTANAAQIQAAITADGTANMGVEVSSPALGTNGVASTAWTKETMVVTSGTGVNFPRYGLVRFRPNGVSFNTYYLDDLVIYQGASVDVTPPFQPTSFSAVLSFPNIVNLSWGIPVGGVDGGGYLVVRYTNPPNADNVPNQNGIYIWGDKIANGANPIEGIVVYTGPSTSWTDVVDNPTLNYFYIVYTVDKAFNYSFGRQSVVLGLNDVSFENANVSVYKDKGVVNVTTTTNVVIADIKVYDTQGKLITEQKDVNAAAATIKDLKVTSQALVVKVTTQDGKIITKKIIN